MRIKDPQRTIFVIDGSQTNLWHLIQTLGEEGYRVVVCARAQTALRMLDEDVPDAILINVADPLLRGYDLLRSIAEDRRLGDVPVLLMTRDAGQADRPEPVAGGRVSYVRLPLDRGQVLSQIRRGIGAGGAAEGARRPAAAQARIS